MREDARRPDLVSLRRALQTSPTRSHVRPSRDPGVARCPRSFRTQALVIGTLVVAIPLHAMIALMMAWRRHARAAAINTFVERSGRLVVALATEYGVHRRAGLTAIIAVTVLSEDQIAHYAQDAQAVVVTRRHAWGSGSNPWNSRCGQRDGR